MKKVISVIAFGLLAVITTSCTDNQRAKGYGGEMKIDLPPGTALVTATWKDTQLWYLYEDRPDGVEPKVYTFQEKSDFGVFEGTVIFTEK